jgi:hypothetical protein
MTFTAADTDSNPANSITCLFLKHSKLFSVQYIYLFVFPSDCLPVYLPSFLSVCLPACLSLSACLFLCLFAEVTELTVIGKLPFVCYKQQSVIRTRWQL